MLQLRHVYNCLISGCRSVYCFFMIIFPLKYVYSIMVYFQRNGPKKKKTDWKQLSDRSLGFYNGCYFATLIPIHSLSCSISELPAAVMFCLWGILRKFNTLGSNSLGWIVMLRWIITGIRRLILFFIMHNISITCLYARINFVEWGPCLCWLLLKLHSFVFCIYKNLTS